MPKNRSPMPKGRSPIWNGNWRFAGRTRPTPPNRLRPTDWLATRGRVVERHSRRKPGAQPGHAGHHRRLVPTAEVSALQVLLPSQCRHCGKRLPQDPHQVTAQGEPRRHQVTEIPSIQPHITEYQFPNVVCGQCGKVNPGATARRDRRTFGTPLGGTDRLSHRSLPFAPARSGRVVGTGPGNPDQFGKHAEMLGRSQPGRGRPLSGTGAAFEGRAGVERR